MTKAGGEEIKGVSGISVLKGQLREINKKNQPRVTDKVWGTGG
jgi:hypothetical protein